VYDPCEIQLRTKEFSFETVLWKEKKLIQIMQKKLSQNNMSIWRYDFQILTTEGRYKEFLFYEEKLNDVINYKILLEHLC
jgi:hypothetical protein